MLSGVSGLSVLGSGGTGAGGADAMDGDGEGCDPVAGVGALVTGTVGISGAGCWYSGGACGESLMGSDGCVGGEGRGWVTGGNTE